MPPSVAAALVWPAVRLRFCVETTFVRSSSARSRRSIETLNSRYTDSNSPEPWNSKSVWVQYENVQFRKSKGSP